MLAAVPAEYGIRHVTFVSLCFNCCECGVSRPCSNQAAAQLSPHRHIGTGFRMISFYRYTGTGLAPLASLTLAFKSFLRHFNCLRDAAQKRLLASYDCRIPHLQEWVSESTNFRLFLLPQIHFVTFVHFTPKMNISGASIFYSCIQPTSNNAI
jgi:hypothetical protein